MQQTALHSALKNYYVQRGATEEVFVDGYWIDVVKGSLLIEIQTRNFGAIRQKLHNLIDKHQVRLVHPIALEKWIIRMSHKGDARPLRRKSPRHGRLEDIFYELVRIPDLLRHPNFSLEVFLIREEEIRLADGKGSWRRNGVSIVDRRLIDIVEQRLYTEPADLLPLLPESLESPFMNRQLAEKLAISPSLATRMSYTLRFMEILRIVGKQNKSYLYVIKE